MLTESQRFDLLHHYLSMEPSIVRYGDEYKVSVHDYGASMIAFYAVCVRDHALCGVTYVTRRTWEAIKTGFSMCFLYNAVLDSLEQQIIRGKTINLQEIRL